MPLGAILIADLHGGLSAVVEAGERLAKEPWYPVVMVTSSTLDHTTAALVQHYGLGESVIRSEDGTLDPERLVAAVRSRPTPNAARVGSYVATRTERLDLQGILTDAFVRGLSHETEAAHSRSTLSRRLGGFGPLKARDWSALGKMIAFLTAPRGTRGTTRFDPRSIKTHVQNYTSLSLAEAQRYVGWEWIVETVLRSWGYLGAEYQEGQPAGERLG